MVTQARIHYMELKVAFLVTLEVVLLSMRIRYMELKVCDVPAELQQDNPGARIHYMELKA